MRNKRTVGFYGHPPPEVGIELQRDFLKYAIDVKINPCICEMPELTGLPKILICHPKDSNQEYCFDILRSTIGNNRDKTFYIFSLGKPGREQEIGNHPNVVYVNRDSVARIFKRIISEALN